MFKKTKDKEIDYISLNNILKTGNKIINIGYFMAIISIILLGTYLLKEWKLLGFVKEFLIVISPIFIGFLIAWLFEPLASKMEKNKIPRILACIIIYLFIIGALILIGYLFVPSLISQIKDFVQAAPSIFDSLTNTALKIIKKFDPNGYINIRHLKKEITTYLTGFGMSIASDLPKYILSIGKTIINGGLNFILGLMVGFYLLYDFNKVNQLIENMLPNKFKSGYKDLTHRINTSLRAMYKVYY